MFKKLSTKIDSYKEEAVKMQEELTSRKAIAPESGGEGEYEKAMWIEAELKKMGFDEISRVDCPDKRAIKGIRPNIVAKYYGEDKTKTLWVMTHMDVVPEGEKSLWKTDPFKVHREGDILYGRGVEDNQQGMIASILTAKAMMEEGYRPPFNFALLINSDEEVGSKHGVEYVLKTKPELFGKNDAFLVPDGGNEKGEMVEIAEKSIAWLKIHTLGKQCHASMPALGNNAFTAGSDLALRLRNGLYEHFNAKDGLFDPNISTFEPTKKDKNVDNVNTIPGDDVFYLDCRVLPTYTLTEIHKKVLEISASIEKDYKVKVSVEPVMTMTSKNPTPKHSPLTKAVIEASKAVYNNNPQPCGIGGGTVGAYFRNEGYHAVIWSKIKDTAHMPNEECDLNNLLGDAKAFIHIAMNLKLNIAEYSYVLLIE